MIKFTELKYKNNLTIAIQAKRKTEIDRLVFDDNFVIGLLTVI